MCQFQVALCWFHQRNQRRRMSDMDVHKAAFPSVVFHFPQIYSFSCSHSCLGAAQCHCRDVKRMPENDRQVTLIKNCLHCIYAYIYSHLVKGSQNTWHLYLGAPIQSQVSHVLQQQFVTVSCVETCNSERKTLTQGC